MGVFLLKQTFGKKGFEASEEISLKQIHNLVSGWCRNTTGDSSKPFTIQQQNLCLAKYPLLQ